MSAIPTGTVAFLFTDIEGSTKLWEAHPEEMRDALRRHDVLCRQIIENRSGYVFKTVGDAYCAAFADASDALAAAAEIRKALAAVEWGPTPILVRMGIHAGAAEERGGDYFGQPVNRAARISAAGSGGQILVSLAASELAKDRLPPGATLRDLGLKRLKDLSSPERLFQLDDDGFPGDFPPLKTLDERPNNLPRMLTSFFGRTEELAKLTDLVEASALVTITGPGGTGKTRLALECGASLVDRFRDGVWFVDLSRISEPALLAPEVARAIGLRETPSVPVEELLASRLGGMETLLIIDNCEHMVEAVAEWAARALAGAGGLRILATSREELLIGGETTFRLAPLEIPRAEAAAAALGQFEAVRLFIDRARATGRGFAVDDDTAPFIAGVCERLEGMPLALELAAAQLRFMTLQDLYRHLGDVFGTLKSAARGLSARQATLRGLVDWSWNLLSEDERRAWRRLSLFRGGFDMEAARAMLGPEAESLVGALLTKSIIGLRTDETRVARYRMLETMREYGEERLRESGEGDEATAALIDWALRFSAAAEPRLFVLRGPEIFDDIDDELANIVPAVEAALEAGKNEAAVAIFYRLNGYFFSFRSPIQEAIRLAERIEPLGEKLDDLSRARTYFVRLVRMIVIYTKFEGSVSLAEEMLALTRTIGDATFIAVAKLMRAVVLFANDDLAGSFRAAYGILAEGDDKCGHRVESEAAGLAGMILLMCLQGRSSDAANEWLGETPPLPDGSAIGTDPLTAAARLMKRSRDFALALGDLYLLSQGWESDLCNALGDLEGARAADLADRDFKVKLDLPGELWYSLLKLTGDECVAGRRKEAEAWAAELNDVAARTAVEYVCYRAETAQLMVLRRFGEWEEAEKLARKLHDGASSQSLELQAATRDLGEILGELGRNLEALNLLETYIEAKQGSIETSSYVLAACAAAWRAWLRLGGDASRAAQAAGAVLRRLETLPKLKCAVAETEILAWRSQAPLPEIDLAAINWTELIGDAHVFVGLMRETQAALPPELFVARVMEGREAGVAALWPIPPLGA